MKLTNKIIAVILLLLIYLTAVSSCNIKSPAKKEPPKSIDVSPEVEEAYNKAVASIVTLNSKTKKQLSRDYESQYGYPFSISEIEAQPGDYLGGTFCYGKFDECIVIFSPTMLTVVSSKTIADEVFSYGSSFALYGYHDGVFYSLEEAYEKGFITKDEVSITAECHRTIGWYNGLRACYEKATSALKLPEEDTRKSIAEAFGDKGSSIAWLNLDNKEQFASPHLRSYGNFNGGTVLLTTLQSEDKNTQTVADSSFESQMGFSLWAYYEETLYSLEEAYEKGFISQHDIGVAAARHNEVERYIKMIIEN